MAAGRRIRMIHRGGYLQCATYLIEGEAGAILVDPGSGALEAEVLAGIGRNGHGLRDIHWCLLTHCHVDHAQGGALLQGRGIRLVASRGTAGLLRVAHREVWHEYPDYVIPIPVDRTVRDGETVMLDGVAVRAVLTPGHTRDSTSYLIRTTSGTAAFIGDLLLSDTEGPGWWGSADFSTETTLESLEKLLAFKPDRVYCGHGPVRGCGWKFLKKALAKGQAGEWELGEVEWHWDVKPPPSFTRRNARSPGETAAPRGADRRKIHGRHPGTPEGRENAAKGAPVRR